MKSTRLFHQITFVAAALAFVSMSACGASSDKASPDAQNRLLQWNRQTLALDYERHGKHNPKWDSSAKLALEAFAQVRGGATPMDKYLSTITAEVKKAFTNGCDDPILKYLYARFVLQNEEHTSLQHAEWYASAAQAMDHDKRPPIRKFYAALRAAESFNMGTASTLDSVHHWRDEAKRFLTEVVDDKGTPGKEVAEAWTLLLDSVARSKDEWHDIYLSLEPAIFKNWPSESGLYLLKGRYYADFAWEARGTGYADSVSSQGWALYTKRLDVAEEALNKAWELNPQDERIARAMLTVELGQGKGRARMEEWFERAMALNTNYYDACWAKLYYLEPKWYGSREAMLEFAAECLNSKKWGGRVPIIVIDTHEVIAKTLGPEARNNYWKRPEVWADIHAAFEKFFRLNPNESGYHHNYALCAWRSEQWDELNRQIPLLGPVNYDYFGGREKFDEMVHLAKEHARSANSR
jgi:hypothetical protein